MKLFYKTSFCCFLLALIVILITERVDAQMQSPVSKGNFTSFTPDKTYANIAKLTALTPLKYRNHPDFGKRVNDSTEWYEQINKRSLKTRTFIGPDNEIITENAYDNINYVDENGWMRAADTKLKPSYNGWSSEQQEIPVYLYTDASTALSLGNKELMIFNKNVHFNQEDISVNNNYTVGDNGMYIKDIVPNADKIIRCGRGGVETDYTIKQPIKLNGDLVISEDIILPAGYTISENADEADENGVGLVVLAPDGKPAAEIRSPRCYDNNYSSSITGVYHFQKRTGGYKLEIEVPSSWLNDSSRQYPVTIDPLVQGTTVAWTSTAKIPSCLTPSYGSATLVDTVPAGITITHFYVSGSWYAFSIAEDLFKETFVTSCGSFGTYVPSTAPGANLPGIASGQFDMSTPLTCCIKPSCSAQTFSLTMELTRDSAGTGCDSTQYGWYDPFWANYYKADNAIFEAYVVGRTVQDSTLSVTPNPICANQCSVTLNALVHFGVPPYTLKYKGKDTVWAIDSISFGAVTEITGCNVVKGIGKLALNILNCPRPSCKPDTTYSVPAPNISDACGNVVGGLSPIALPVKEVPDVTANPETVCSGANVNLALSSSCLSGVTYKWTGSNDSSGSGNPINDVVNNNGTTNETINYAVTPTGNGCAGDATVLPVTVTPFTVTITPSNPILCKGSSVTLTVTGDANQYSWSPATGLSCTTCADPVANDTVAHIYKVTGTENGTSCTAFDEVLVGVYPAPTDTASPTDTIIYVGQKIKLFARSNGTITWSPSTGLSATTGDSVIAAPITTTTYIATATIPGDSCLVLTDLIIKVYATLIVPSAFTPNSGDENSRLHVLPNMGIGLRLQEFRVYNRWGQMVYETNSINDPGWDGTFNGKPEPMGTYVYYAEFYKEGQTQLFTTKGDVILLR
jgi:gliding motility-associated-like protein